MKVELRTDDGELVDDCWIHEDDPFVGPTSPGVGLVRGGRSFGRLDPTNTDN